MKERKRVSILGVKVDALNLPEAVSLLEKWGAEKTPRYVCLSPAHAILGAHDDSRIKEIYNQSDLNAPDGMPIAWFLQKSGFPTAGRVYGPDLMKSLLAHPTYRHYFYGGREATITALEQKMAAAGQKLIIAGTEHPPFRPATPAEDQATLEKINAAQPDFLWVGIGSPRQEIWIAEHRGQLEVPVMVGVGAAFDFLSGQKKQAPGWIQKMGMEWFFRLLSEPKRLFRRYVLGYPRFVWLVAAQLLKLKNFN